ncbi:hypothetical protein Plhal703r1_c15g0073531 [Plasmopara halstedii]
MEIRVCLREGNQFVLLAVYTQVILLKVVTWTMLEKVLATFLVCETNERNAIVVLSHVS